MTETQRYFANKIYNTISKQNFADWYGLRTSSFEDEDYISTGGDFDNHMRGEEDCLSKEEILVQIVNMFGF